MVIDTSALIAILLDEAEAERIRHAMRKDLGHLYISAASVVEAYTVIFAKKGSGGIRGLQSLLENPALQLKGSTSI